MPEFPVWEWTEQSLVGRNRAATQAFPLGAPAALIALAEEYHPSSSNPNSPALEIAWRTPSTGQRWSLEQFGPYFVLKPWTRANLTEKIRTWAELGAAGQIHREGPAWESFLALVGEPPPKKKIISSDELLSNLLPLLTQELVKKPTTLRWDDMYLETTIWVEADLGQLALALAELYRNAQETNIGTIQLRIEAEHDLEISVCHLHHGQTVTIWPERMGEPFVTRKPGHVGLGLARARRIAFLHDGELIWETNRYGSEFSLILPKEKANYGRT